MILEAEQFAEDDKRVKERVDARNELEAFTYTIKNQLSDQEKLGGKLSDNDKETADAVVSKVIFWLERNQDATMQDFKDQKKELESVVQSMTSKLYGSTEQAGDTGEELSEDSRDEL